MAGFEVTTEAFVYNNLGIVYQRKGENGLAVTAFRQAIRLNSRYAAPRVLMGASLLALGNASEAIKQLRVAAKLDFKQPLIHLELAKAYKQEGDITQMVNEYRITSRLDPGNPEYMYQLGRAYQELAEWCYRQMIHSNPHSARVYQALAENYRVEGKKQYAVRAYKRAVQADPELPGIHLALAQVYLASGQVEQAKEEVRKELALVPESAEALALKEKLERRRP